MENIKKLRKYLESHYMNIVIITSFLGYKSTNTVNMWVSKKKIPAHQEERTMSFIAENSKTIVAL